MNVSPVGVAAADEAPTVASSKNRSMVTAVYHVVQL